MNNFHDHPIYFLRRQLSVHWFLFGINSHARKVYFLEVVGNDSTKTSVLSMEDARNLWRHLTTNGFERIELRDAGAIPLHLDQRIREWWKFVNNDFNDKLHKDDPWGSCTVIGNDAKTLSDIAEGKSLEIADNSYRNQVANFWEYREPEEDGSDRNNIEDDADDDNYWNKEGVFESESDKGDEPWWEVDDSGDSEQPVWRTEDQEEYEQQDDASYQQWATEEEQRDDEIEEAMEEYYKTQDCY